MGRSAPSSCRAPCSIPAWMDYIGDFDLVLSYFYDPDSLFLANLERCKPGQMLTHSPRVPEDFGRPAAHHFAKIVEPLGLALGEDAASEIFPSPEDVSAGRAFLAGLKPGTRLVAIHPGSGSESSRIGRCDRGRNWAGGSTAKLRLTWRCCWSRARRMEKQAQFILEAWKDLPHLRARWLPLPILTALLREAALFLGHDSGVTHLAAAARRDLPVIALFGPSDPTVWAPPRPGVSVLKGVPRCYLICRSMKFYTQPWRG